MTPRSLPLTRSWTGGAGRGGGVTGSPPKLLILADSGGSNGARCRLWKCALQERLADRFGLAVTVCHYPHRRLQVESH